MNPLEGYEEKKGLLTKSHNILIIISILRNKCQINQKIV